MRDIVIILN